MQFENPEISSRIHPGLRADFMTFLGIVAKNWGVQWGPGA
jgi:hypothetical protein